MTEKSHVKERVCFGSHFNRLWFPMVNPGFRSFRPSWQAVCSEQRRSYLTVIARKQTYPAARPFPALLEGHFGSWPIEGTACIQGRSVLTLSEAGLETLSQAHPEVCWSNPGASESN